MKTLETQRLILRDWNESDAEAMYEYAQVEGVGEMAGWPHHTSIEVSRSIIRRFMEQGDAYALVLKAEDKVIGSLGIHNRSLDPEYPAENQKELGYVLGKAYWGIGLVAEAAREAICYAFEEINADVLWCGHYAHNPQSRRVIEKLGFTFYRDCTFEAPPLNKTFKGKSYIMTKEDYKLGR